MAKTPFLLKEIAIFKSIRVGTLIVAGAFQIFLKSNDFPLPHGSHDVKRLFFGYYVTTLKAKGAQVTPFCHMTMGKLMRK